MYVPRGVVVPSQHEKDTLCVNGMSNYARDGMNANSAILVNVNTDDFLSDHPLAGIEFQRQLEKRLFNSEDHYIKHLFNLLKIT